MYSCNNFYLKFKTSILDIIGYSWHFYFLNFKKIILYTLIPTLLPVLGQIIIGLPATIASKQEMYYSSILCSCPIGIFLIICGFFISTYFDFALFRAFFNIMTGKPASYTLITKYTLENISKITKMAFVITLQKTFIGGVIFIFMYMIALALVVISYFLLNFADAQVKLLLQFFLGELFMQLFFVVFSIISIIFSLQILLISIENFSVTESIKKTFFLVLKSFKRIIFFIISLSVIFYVLSLYLSLPSYALLFFEMYTKNAGISENIPIQTFIIISVWSSIVSIFVTPFVSSAIAMFYYDLKSKKQGLDLELTLKKFQQI